MEDKRFKFSRGAGDTSQSLWTTQALGLVVSLALGYRWAPPGHVGFVWAGRRRGSKENEFWPVFSGQ